MQAFPCSANYGTFSLKFDGQTTTNLQYNSGATQVQTALENLNTVGSVNIIYPAGRTTWCSLNATLAPVKIELTTTTNFVGDTPGIQFNSDNLATNEVQVIRTSTSYLNSYGSTTTIEKQAVYCSATSGKVVLNFDGQSTAPINYNANRDTVKNALNSISTITSVRVTSSSNIFCTKAGNTPFTIFFEKVVNWKGNVPALGNDINNDLSQLDRIGVHEVQTFGTDTTANEATVFLVEEIQLSSCNRQGGDDHEYRLLFDGVFTRDFAWDTSATDLQSYINEMSHVTNVTVKYTNFENFDAGEYNDDMIDVFCTGNVVMYTFKDVANWKGDMPKIRIDAVGGQTSKIFIDHDGDGFDDPDIVSYERSTQGVAPLSGSFTLTFEGEETKGDLDAISNLIMWIYQTNDVEKLEQMLNLAMSAGGNALPAPADAKEDKPEADKKDSKITDAPSTGAAANIPGSEGNNIQVPVLNKQIEELFDKNNQLEEEKKLTDEEIAQLNQEIYKLNDKILQM
jgi:hypothetical protein